MNDALRAKIQERADQILKAFAEDGDVAEGLLVQDFFLKGAKECHALLTESAEPLEFDLNAALEYAQTQVKADTDEMNRLLLALVIQGAKWQFDRLKSRVRAAEAEHDSDAEIVWARVKDQEERITTLEQERDLAVHVNKLNFEKYVRSVEPLNCRIAELERELHAYKIIVEAVALDSPETLKRIKAAAALKGGE